MPRRKPVAASAAPADRYVRCTPGTACAPVVASEPVKRKRGRPRKHPVDAAKQAASDALLKLMTEAEEKPAQTPRVTSGENPSREVLILSDVHIPCQDRKALDAVKQLIRWRRFYWIIGLGDLCDFGQVGRFDKGPNDPLFVVDEIEEMKNEFNPLRDYCERMTLVAGNHDFRLEKYLRGATPHAVKGLKGLTFPEICKAHGLRDDIDWYKETVSAPPLVVGDYILRHGDVGSGKFGGGLYPARTMLSKSHGVNTAAGHTHRMDMATATAFGKTTVAISNGCLASTAEYAGMNANWQKSVTILELNWPDYKTATPHPLLINDGVVSYAGRTFIGRSS